MKLTRINAHDCIAPGTPVQVLNKRGIVTASIMAIGSNNGGNGYVSANTVRLTEIRDASKRKDTWKPMPFPIERIVNYSCIQIIS